MTTIPEAKNSTVSAINQLHQDKPDGPRPHLGASLLGHPCHRYLWLSFRWVAREKFSGRMLRLFRRGQNEEAIVVDDLRGIGCVVDAEEDGKQYRVDFGNHVSGSMDGIVQSGLPEAEKSPHVLEIKTHSLKSFKDVSTKGVQTSKPQHYAQMQVYMLGTGIHRALYFAVCKNDDALHVERIKFDKEAAQAYVDRGHWIVSSDRMPEPISADGSWYQCKFCSAHDLCHGSKTIKAQDVSCRTCAHSTAEKDGTWSCARWGVEIPSLDAQVSGCDDHVIHPDLVPWQMKTSDDGLTATYTIEGNPVKNGAGGMLSTDILTSPGMAADISPIIERFDAKLIGVTHVT